MAVQDSTYLANVLGIKSFVHRQRFQLKALDLVLFGHFDVDSPVKDIILAVLIGLLVVVLVLFRVHKNRSREKVEELSTMLSRLRDMETDFEGRFDEEDQREKMMTSSADAEHIEALKNQLLEAERRLEMTVTATGMDNGGGMSIALQPLLRRTYELEMAYLGHQKLECLDEMRAAKEFVDKMRRKQTSVFNSLKLATGASSCTDDIDSKIFSLKARMEKIKYTAEECQQRWIDIESLCGFSITGPFAPSPPFHQNHFHQASLQQQAPKFSIGSSTCAHPLSVPPSQTIASRKSSSRGIFHASAESGDGPSPIGDFVVVGQQHPAVVAMSTTKDANGKDQQQHLGNSVTAANNNALKSGTEPGKQQLPAKKFILQKQHSSSGSGGEKKHENNYKKALGKKSAETSFDDDDTVSSSFSHSSKASSSTTAKKLRNLLFFQKRKSQSQLPVAASGPESAGNHGAGGNKH